MKSRQIIKAGLYAGSVFLAAGALTLTSMQVTPTGYAAVDSGIGACGGSNVRLLGFSDNLNKSSFGGFAVSELSGITYDHASGSYYAIADRAGAVPSHVFRLSMPLGQGMSSPSVEDVTVLHRPDGTPHTGANFDGEGIDLGRHGEFVIASESGSAAGEQPEIKRFSGDGSYLSDLDVDGKFLIGANNLSFESLSISPNGNKLFTATEAPLAADGRTADLRSRIRIVSYDERGPAGFQPAGEFFYLTEPGRTTADLGVAEVLALSEDELLVLERGFVAGEGNTIRIFRVSLTTAEDVSGVPSLAASGLTPLAKTLLVDLVTCPDAGAISAPGAVQPNPLLENFEAMALGPNLPGGQRSIVLLSDDNGATNQNTRVVVLTAGPTVLNGTSNDE